MAGNRRIVVGNIAQGNLRGKALSDALARELNNEEKEDGAIKRKIMGTKKKAYGKK